MAMLSMWKGGRKMGTIQDRPVGHRSTSRKLLKCTGRAAGLNWLVKKLRAARERKRAAGMKVEGRKSHAEKNPEIAAELAALGFKTTAGKAISAS